MAEDQMAERKEPRAPWTKIFTAFKVALDIKKLLLAAAGILATWFGWWLLAIVFYNARSLPKPEDFDDYKGAGYQNFVVARMRWNLLHEMAGTGAVPLDAGDIAKDYAEYEALRKLDEPALKARGLAIPKPSGRLRTWPGYEDRGPNPYLLIAATIKSAGGKEHMLPWDRGQVVNWFFHHQFPVLIEPLVKFLAPVAYFFDRGAGGWNRLYLILVILWTLAVWGFFGGAITRLAVAQVARNEKISLRESLRFSKDRCQSFFSAPVFPLVFLGILTLILIIFGLFSGLIPVIGDILISGLLWPVVLVIGLIMAVVLVGLVGWPLMYATISAEGSDSFDALSRSYSYVFQAPWHYLWYSVVALVYGAVLIFFVGLMGSLLVYLGEWGIRQTPFLTAVDREPSYLFIDAPTSYGWRDLFLHSSPNARPAIELITPAGTKMAAAYEMTPDYLSGMKWYNYVGAFLVAVWLYLVFFLVVGFGYSFFWTASAIIYLLMRYKVDDTDMDEIHMEEEEPEAPFPADTTSPTTSPPSTAPAGNVTMVESPTLRTPAATVSAATPPVTPGETSPTESRPAGDGSPPPPTSPA